jgi:TRAP-type transport system periplasmic protein
MHRSIRSAAVGAAAVFAGILALGPAWGQAQTYVMKITLPTINEQTHQYAKNLAARVAADSGGRIKTEVYPASQLGSIPRQIEGVQFGAIQCAVIPPEFFVGVDERFAILGAPGLVGTMDEARRLSIDPGVHKLMLSLGANKGLYGAALFIATPSDVVSRTPIRHLDDFKSKKLRVLASDFQTLAFAKLGATPVAMSLGDVLPAIQQGTIDGAVSSLTVFTSMSYQDAAKYLTLIGQPYIFLAVEYSAKWRAGLPTDLQQVIDKDAADEAVKIFPIAVQYNDAASKLWTDKGGELISLSPEEHAAMMESMGSVAADVAKKTPELEAAYQTVADAATRIRSTPN